MASNWRAVVNKTGGRVKKAQLGKLVRKGIQKGIGKSSELLKGVGKGIAEYKGKDIYGKDIINKPSNKVKDLFKGVGKSIKKYKGGGNVPNGPLVKKKGPFKGSTLKRGGKIKRNGKR